MKASRVIVSNSDHHYHWPPLTRALWWRAQGQGHHGARSSTFKSGII